VPVAELNIEEVLRAVNGAHKAIIRTGIRAQIKDGSASHAHAIDALALADVYIQKAHDTLTRNRDIIVAALS
jgi:hypothetical protein